LNLRKGRTSVYLPVKQRVLGNGSSAFSFSFAQFFLALKPVVAVLFQVRPVRAGVFCS
jgi:hypothetical protein